MKCELTTNSVVTTERICRPITITKLENFCENLHNTDWSFTYSSKSAQTAFSSFFSSFLDLYYHCFPIVTLKLHTQKSQSKWYNDELRNMRETLKAVDIMRKSPGAAEGQIGRINKYGKSTENVLC
ncbi:hypothetical protein Zmor_011579 [Zophobas morio]|uniref:Uncharacterized protein n=1 Tax=Zophobas morio TaxID=2755281 RepID=A0AA38ML50_9CUCU|nr:hypothetical protein Zmor_011579 [Zophobas morio]